MHFGVVFAVARMCRHGLLKLEQALKVASSHILFRPGGQLMDSGATDISKKTGTVKDAT